MPMNEKELLARDAKRDIGAELLDAVRRVKAGEIGRVHMVPVSIAQEARQRLGLSQAQFAAVLGVSKRTLQDWEQKRRQPSGAARALIKIAAIRPDLVHEALSGEAPAPGVVSAKAAAAKAPGPRGGARTLATKAAKVLSGEPKGARALPKRHGKAL